MIRVSAPPGVPPGSTSTIGLLAAPASTGLSSLGRRSNGRRLDAQVVPATRELVVLGTPCVVAYRIGRTMPRSMRSGAWQLPQR